MPSCEDNTSDGHSHSVAFKPHINAGTCRRRNCLNTPSWIEAGRHGSEMVYGLKLGDINENDHEHGKRLRRLGDHPNSIFPSMKNGATIGPGDLNHPVVARGEETQIAVD